MNTKTLRIVVCAWLGLAALLAAPANATAPNTLTYQGRLKEGGAPVNAARNVDIALCNAFSGGTCNYFGGQSVQVSSGLFHLDFPVPPGTDLTTGSWWVEVKVAGNILIPREPLTASAYAVYASSAGTLTAAPASGGVHVSTHLFMVSGSSVGIGTASPEAPLHVVGVSSFTTSITVNGVQFAYVPRGMVSFFNLAACPSGWSALVAAEGRYLVGLNSGGTLGSVVGNNLSNSENRATGAHKHTLFAGPVGSLQGAGGVTTVSNPSGGTQTNIGTGAGWFTTTVTMDIPAAPNNVAGTNAPYMQLLVCQKD